MRGKGKTFENVFPFPLKLPYPLSKLFNNERPEFVQNSGLSDARRQAASLSPSAACRQAGAASHGGDEAAFAKGAGKYINV
jgi:hypothetical protein